MKCFSNNSLLHFQVESANDKWKMENDKWKIGPLLPSAPAVCSCRLLLLLPSRRGRRSFLDQLAELHDPDATVDVVKVDQAVMWLCTPGER